MESSEALKNTPVPDGVPSWVLQDTFSQYVFSVSPESKVEKDSPYQDRTLSRADLSFSLSKMLGARLGLESALREGYIHKTEEENAAALKIVEEEIAFLNLALRDRAFAEAVWEHVCGICEVPRNFLQIQLDMVADTLKKKGYGRIAITPDGEAFSFLTQPDKPSETSEH